MKFDDFKTRYIQDPIHIGTKMKTRFLKQDVMLPMGSYVATSKHLNEIIETFPKNCHFLSSSTLNPLDKMNFKSVLKIISNDVINCLDYDKKTMATQTYLKVMQFVLDSFLDRGLKAVERVFKIWFSVFFLRQWRCWIKRSKEYNLTDCFITLNAYTCIEMNAHSMLMMILDHIEKGTLDEFYPWLLGSQQCEEWFRAARSLTSTLSTIINFTAQEFIHKSKRIEFVHEATYSLSEEFNFPRSSKKKADVVSQYSLTKQDIFDSIECAKDDAISCVRELNMTVEESDWKICDLKVIEEEPTKPIEVSISTSAPSFNIKADLLKNIKSMNFKVAEKIPEDLPNSAFVEIEVDGKSVVIKKSCLVWMFSEKGERVSTDRIYRFRKSAKPYHSPLQLEKYYAVYYEDQFYIGRILDLGAEACKVKFLKNNLDTYVWPSKDDICQVNNEFIFYGPLNVGNYPFRISKEISRTIDKKYKLMKYQEKE